MLPELINDVADKYLDNIIAKLTAPVELHTIQFWRNDHPENPNHRPSPQGSGVLLRDGDDFFIATASHVVEDRNQTHIGVYTRVKDFFELGTVCNVPTSRSEINNHTDIAVWVIEPEMVEDIASRDWWYDINDALFNHQESSEPKYLIYGFPATKIDIRLKDKALVQHPFKFITRGASHTLEGQRAQKTRTLNFLLDFHRKKIENVRDGHRQWAPDPHGISGCGLWYLDPTANRFRLVGIMTEWKHPKERLSLMMATRIDVVRAAINFYRTH